MYEDLAARQSRWGAITTNLGDDWDMEDDDDAAVGLSSTGGGNVKGLEMALPQASVTPAWNVPPVTSTKFISPSFNTKPAPFSWPTRKVDEASDSTASTHTLRLWIDKLIDLRKNDVAENKKHLEKSVRILHSLAGKIVGEYNRGSDDEIIVHPSFITLQNVIVTETDTELSGHFDESGDSIFFNDKGGEDKTRKKYLAMNALGRIAYEMCMPEDRPSVLKFSSFKLSNVSSAGQANTLSTNRIASLQSDCTQDTEDAILDEDEIMNMLKNQSTRISEENDSSGLISTMLDANIPFPLVRFTSDLLDDEHKSVSRHEHSYSTFYDVISDLKQMVDNPDDFLHASSPDRWKLVFGDKLYGRDEDTKAFLDAADRVITVQDDPLFGGLLRLTGKKREVIMVSGHSGAGKSQLVKSGGALLEKRGWCFLRCKFDGVVHPEPLSILAHAFEEYFASFASNEGSVSERSGLQDILQRLKKTISPEGLGHLAKHIPSLSLILDVEVTSSTIESNETMMATLFRKLLQALSSKKTPILFFIDDLQWADPLSFALLTTLVQGTNLHLSSTNGSTQDDRNTTIDDDEEEEIQVMFVGSYRDNEVYEDHPLSKVLSKFQHDSFINMTTISLSRFTFETLNDMLSESLCVPVRKVRSLSELVIQKTDGQPLHIIAFVQALCTKNILAHSFTRGWEWDSDSIEFCPITDNVAELYAFNLKRLPRDILLGLQIVSCFGSQIDQHVLSFAANYDDENSVDISEAINIAVSEGLIERTAQLISFTHDMIQKATINSIQKADLVPLLRKLTAALIRNASATDKLGDVLFVVVDLINRIGSDACFPTEQALFAELNYRAGSKAITVPDFAGAAKYTENGIAFLSDNCWEAQYDLSIGLYETAALSHFSSHEGDKNLLMKRINAVFEHAKDFSDQFKTHCVWVQVLAMKDVPRAIEANLSALEKLGEPILDFDFIDYNSVRDKCVKLREQFLGEKKKKLLSTNRLTDCKKSRAMKVLACLMPHCYQTNYLKSLFIACRMVEMSINYGHCESSVIGAAGFAASLAIIIDDLKEARAWGHTTLSLMELYRKDVLVPPVYAILYGSVFIWNEEPMQSQLEPLAQGVRLSFAMGNVQYSMNTTALYIMRSFTSGSTISVLSREVEVLARQHGNHFGDYASSGAPEYSPIVHFFLTPLYIILRELKQDEPEEEKPSFPFDKFRFLKVGDILKAALEGDRVAMFHNVLSYQTFAAFLRRDMENALKSTDTYCEYFLNQPMQRLLPAFIYHQLFEALITFYFMRQTGEEQYWIRGQNATSKIKEQAVHSDWNFQNKLLLAEAEMYNTQKDFDKATSCYEASVRAAQEHKFLHEEAIASELAGIFFLERGLHEKSQSFFEHSMKCYEKWGASAVAKRIEDVIHTEFGPDCTQSKSNDEHISFASADKSEENYSKKRQLY